MTVGSDAHEAKDLGWKFEEMKDFLAECGFKYYAVYEWTGNTVKKTAVVFNVTDDAESCSTLKGMWPECSAEGSSCACDNEILVVTTTVQEEVESKTDAYVAAMHDQCGILVEIESSSSSVVNNCGFEKTASEWTFITDEVTEIFTWDSNDQYIFTHIARETYEDDEIYEGCEDCKTGAVKCVEDAAIATEAAVDGNSWADYVIANVTLKAGANTLTIKALTEVNPINIDSLRFTPVA